MPNRRSILWSFNYAIEGIVYALRTQRNMRVHVALSALVLVASLLLGVEKMGLVAVVFSITLVFAAELINTAIEASVDLATDHYDPLAKTAKDVAAGAVLVAAMNALVVGYLVLFEPLVKVLDTGLEWVELSPASLTVIALGLVLLVTLVMKAATHSEGSSWVSGGWPSGHTAVAFAAATIVGFITGSAAVLVLCYFIAFLVAQSRIEAEIHSVPEVVLGAVLGIAIVTLVFQVFFR